ncbi:MAG: rod shape-determining protein RodA [Candidatus Paceibacterota bacterium]|jgi:rod shape determining protein RodA
MVLPVFARRIISGVDWILFFAVLPLLFFGLVTMSSFTDANMFFEKQLIWIAVGLFFFFLFASIDAGPLKKTGFLVSLFAFALALLLLVAFTGSAVKGARSWFNLGFFSFEPADPVKLLIILMLAKYFSRRHVEIAHYKHILISGLYAFIPFILIMLQPDFGSGLIIFLIWLGMVMVSGVSKKHLFIIFSIGVISFGMLWMFVFKPYQKNRILTFIHPLTDIRGAGYNAYQSTIAVGSGEIWGKGIGYGTQSRLKFLPEYETDFVFAAFAEEWGFAGIFLFFLLIGIVIWRILTNALIGATNFEMLFGMGLAIFFMSHIIVNVGMNIGLLPVTGIPLPFMSYGGSHLVTEFIGLGVLMSMRRNSRAAHRDAMKNEFLGI